MLLKAPSPAPLRLAMLRPVPRVRLAPLLRSTPPCRHRALPPPCRAAAAATPRAAAEAALRANAADAPIVVPPAYEYA
jgi:hypothetical protein